MQRLKPLLISTIILLLVCACGQKGPLYLPGGETPEELTAEDPAREQTEEDDGNPDEENP